MVTVIPNGKGGNGIALAGTYFWACGFCHPRAADAKAASEWGHRLREAPEALCMLCTTDVRETMPITQKRKRRGLSHAVS